MHKNSSNLYAIKKIPLNREEVEKAFKELNLMKGLKSLYIVECIDSWIEEDTSEFKPQSSLKISSSHPILDPKNTFLLYIQMEFCCETLNEVIKHLSNELMENNSEIMKTLYYYICCELLTEIIECLNYLHERNITHTNLKPSNILISDGKNGRFVKLSDSGLSVIHELYTNESTRCAERLKYRAPEVIKTKVFDSKADIYSLGIIIQELFFSENDL
jgi:serine/threonine protein kinase